jgi:hypothetical protein
MLTCNSSQGEEDPIFLIKQISHSLNVEEAQVITTIKQKLRKLKAKQQLELSSVTEEISSMDV